MTRRTSSAVHWSIGYEPCGGSVAKNDTRRSVRPVEIVRCDAGRKVSVQMPPEFDLQSAALFAALQANRRGNAPPVTIAPVRADPVMIDRMRATLPLHGAVFVPTVRGSASAGERTLLVRAAKAGMRTVTGTTIPRPNGDAPAPQDIGLADRSLGIVFVRPARLVEGLHGRFRRTVLAMRAIPFTIHNRVDAYRQLREIAETPLPADDTLLDGVVVHALAADAVRTGPGIGVLPLPLPANTDPIHRARSNHAPRPGPRGQLWTRPNGTSDLLPPRSSPIEHALAI